MAQEFDPKNFEVAKSNGAITDLQYGEYIRDGEGSRAMFLSYGDNAPLYVNLAYPRIDKTIRIPNSELKRTR